MAISKVYLLYISIYINSVYISRFQESRRNAIYQNLLPLIDKGDTAVITVYVYFFWVANRSKRRALASEYVRLG